MSNLVDGIMEQLGAQGVAQIASSLGVDEKMMGPAVAAAIPAILGGMATNARQPAGAESLASALDDHSPTIFDGLGALLGGGGDGPRSSATSSATARATWSRTSPARAD